jgi:hypothetical protein
MKMGMAELPDPLNPQTPLFTYEDVKKERGEPVEQGPSLDAILRHVDYYAGEKVGGGKVGVFHEIKSEVVHLDVVIAEPTEKEPYWTYVTSGMSDLPMTGRDGSQRYAELYLRLPKEWKAPAAAGDEWKAHEWFWPIQLLKFVARFPHQYKTMLWVGHTLDNKAPPEPWSKSVEFNAAFLANGRTLPEEFDTLTTPDREITFLALYPVYAEESALARKEGAGRLWEKFVEKEISEVVNPKRECLVPRAAGEKKRSFLDRLRGK